MTVEEIKPIPNQDIIGLLEELLEDAKEGKTIAIAVAGVNHDCTTFNCFSAVTRPVTLLGEIRLLERDVVDCCTETRRQPSWDVCE